MVSADIHPICFRSESRSNHILGLRLDGADVARSFMWRIDARQRRGNQLVFPDPRRLPAQMQPQVRSSASEQAQAGTGGQLQLLAQLVCN
jgi:hypothetical protein